MLKQVSKLAIAWLLIAPGLAYAQQAVTVVNGAGNPAQTNVVNYQQVQSLVVQAIQALAQSNSADSNAVMNAMSRLTSAQLQGQTQYGVQQARLAALQGATSGAASCDALLSASAIAGYAQSIAAWREQLADQNAAWFGDAPTVAGQPNPAAVGRAPAFRRLVGAECNNGFMGAASLAAGACGNQTTPGPNSGLSTNADILFQHHSLSTVEVNAAENFLSSAATPQPQAPINTSIIHSGNGPAVIARRHAREARVSTARWLMSDLIASRIPWTSGPPALAQTMNGLAAQMPGMFPQTNGSYFPNGVSLDDYLRVRGASFAFDQKFLAADAGATNIAKPIKDLDVIEGYRAWLATKTYLLDQKIAFGIGILISQKEMPTREIGQSQH